MIIFLHILYNNLWGCIIYEKNVCLQRHVIKTTFNSSTYLLHHSISIVSLFYYYFITYHLFCHFLCHILYPFLFFINLLFWQFESSTCRSASSFKTKIIQVNNTVHLVTMQCSAGKPWLSAFMRTPLDKRHLPKHCRRPSAPPCGNSTPRWQCSPQQDTTTLQKLLKNDRGNRMKSSRCQFGLQIRQITIWPSSPGTSWNKPCGAAHVLQPWVVGANGFHMNAGNLFPSRTLHL